MKSLKKFIASLLVATLMFVQIPFAAIAEEIEDANSQVQEQVNESNENENKSNNEEGENVLSQDEIDKIESQQNTDEIEEQEEQPQARGVAPRSSEGGDRSSAYGEGFKVALRWGGTSNSTYTWNATEKEKRVIKLTFYYQNEVSPKAYDVGDIRVTIPGIGKLNRNSTKKASDIAADVLGSEELKRDWSYTYDSENDVYTFYNNHAIEIGETFNGSFEMLYEFNSRESVNDFSKTIQATLNDGETNVISSDLNFEYTSLRDTFYIEKKADALISYDGLHRYIPEGKTARDYGWVKYTIQYNTKQLNARGLKSRYMIDTIPAECVVALNNNIVVNPDGSKTFKVSETFVPESYVRVYEIIVGYPESMIGHAVENTAYIYGTYYDEEEPVLLDSSTVSIVPERVLPEIPGILTSKSMSPAHIYIDELTNELKYTAQLHANIKTSSDNSGVYKVAITDDLMEICSETKTNQDTNTIKTLEGDEYTFTGVRVPGVSSFTDGNGFPLEQGDYNLKLYALYRSDVVEGDLSSRAISNYTQVFDGKWTNSGAQVTFDEDVVAVRAELDGLIENIPSFYMYADGKIKNLKDNIESEEYVNPKYIINYEFIEYEDENGTSLIPEIGRYDYSQERIYDRDLAIYGKGVGRSYDIMDFLERSGYYYSNAKIDLFKVDENIQYFTTNLKHSAQMDNRDASEIKNIEIVGVVEKNELETLIETLKLTYSNLNFKKALPSDTNIEEYLMERATITKDGNEIRIEFDFSDNPIISKQFTIGYEVDAHVIYDAYYDDFNPVYVVKTYAYTPNGTMSPQNRIEYEGKNMASSRDTGNILLALASHQQLANMVRTVYSGDFVQEDAVTPMTEEYTYRLKLRNGYNTLINTEFIDVLEHAELTEVDGEHPYNTSEWFGIFSNVDTSYMEGKGFGTRVYYANTINPQDNDWVLMESHQDGKWSTTNGVRAVKINIDGEIPENSIVYADINMIAPYNSDYEDKKAYNTYSINCDAIDLYSGIRSTYMQNMPSNAVDVRLVEKAYDIYITKVDAISKAKLHGAEFAIYDSDGNKIRSDYTGILGNVPFKNLKAGKYIIREETTPEGYKTLDDFALVINSDGSYSILAYPKEKEEEIIDEVEENVTFTSEGEYAWTQNEDGTWQSNNSFVDNSTSSMISEISLEYNSTLSFAWAASSESIENDYLYITITDLETGEKILGTGENARNGGLDSGEDYDSLGFWFIDLPLEKGRYTVEFTYKKDGENSAGLDKGYVRDVVIHYLPIETVEENLDFTSKGEYAWTQNEDGVWQSNNSFVDDSVSTMKSDFTMKADGTISIEYSAISDDSDYLYYEIMDRASDTVVYSNDIGGLYNGEDYNSLNYINENLNLSKGRYSLEFSYWKDEQNSEGLDKGFVKKAKISYESTDEITENIQFTSKGEYAWTQNEDGIWQSNNYFVDDSVSTMKSDFTMKIDGTLSIEYSALCDDSDVLYYEIIDKTNGMYMGGNQISGLYNGKDYDSLHYIWENINLPKGRYSLEFTYWKDEQVSDGLDRGFVKNAQISYMPTTDITETIAFNSEGEYAWTQNEDGIWQSNNSSVDDSSSIISSEFTMKTYGSLYMELAVSSEENDTLHFVITDLESGDVVNEGEMGGIDCGDDYETLYFYGGELPLAKGRYRLELSYNKDGENSDGLDKGFVKNAEITYSSYDEVTEDVIFTSEGEYAWTQNEDGTWQSNNSFVDDSNSIMTSRITMESDGMLSFKYSVSSEEGDGYSPDYLMVYVSQGRDDYYYNTFGGLSLGEEYDSLKFMSVGVFLPQGTYDIEFAYYKDGQNSGGLDKAFAKDIKVSYLRTPMEEIYSGNSRMENGIPTIDLDVDNEREKGSITVHKIDEYKDQNKQEIPLANVEFNLLDEDGEFIANGITDSNGELTFNDLDWGKLYTVEETRALQGYEIISQNVYLSKSNKDATVIVKNMRKVANAKITKQDKVDGTKLEGAKYGLFAKEDIYDKDGEICYEANTLVEEKVTNEEGQATFENIIWGEYYIKETETVYGYELSKEEYEFTVNSQNVDTEIQFNENEERSKANLQLVKLNDIGNFLPGAKFKLFNEDGTEATLKEMRMTNSLRFYNIGDYGWKQNEDGTWQSDNRHKNKSSAIMESEEFSLTSPETLTFDWCVSSEEKDDYLEYKVYYLDEGYSIVGKISGTSYGSTYDSLNYLTVNRQLEPGNYKLRFTYYKDYYDSKGLDLGYVKNISINRNEYEEEITIPNEFVTNDQGQLNIEGIEWGDYYIQEVDAPVGYELSDIKYHFTVDRETFQNNNRTVISVRNEDTDEVQSIITNNPKLGKVTLTKYACDSTGAETTNTLQDAVYELYKSNGELVGEYTTDENGQIEVDNLDWNSYYFLEKEAPSGYSTSDKKISFVINSKNVSFEQNLVAYDKMESGEITINKVIPADSIYGPHGNSSFIFKIVGKDENNQEQITLYRTVTFTEEDKANVDIDGNVTKTIKISELNPYKYEITEEENYRYDLDDIIPETTNASKDNNIGKINLLDSGLNKGEITFSNKKQTNSLLTHNEVIMNSIQNEYNLIGFEAIPKYDKYYVGYKISPRDFKYKLYYSGGQIDEVDYLSDITIEGNNYYTVDSPGDYIVNIEYNPLYSSLTSSVSMKLIDYPQSYFTYANYPTGVYITGIAPHLPSPEVLVIPSEYNGHKVLGVMYDNYSYPMSNIANVKSVVISEGVESIGDRVFFGCSNITSIDIPEGLKRIGGSAFYGCTGLTSIDIPDTVTKIESDAFHGCSGLTSIDMPDTVTIIGSKAFYGCTGLTSIDIPEGVTSIGSSAFYECTGLTSIDIPEGVTSIENSTFAGCSGLTSIDIPEGVTSIGYAAFSGCSGLTSIDIPEGVTSIGGSTFYGCSGLTSIDIPEGVTSIGSSTFYGCSGLTSIDIPEGVTSIGDYAFRDCSSLASIDIPEGVTSIGGIAFAGCTSLTSIDIPEGVTSIGSSTFYGCSSLTSIDIPEGVTKIGSSAFYRCSRLTSIDIPDGVTSIDGEVFYGCNGLTSIDIPEGVTSIGIRAFYGCNGLTSIDIPEGVTSIGSYAFQYCSSLTSVDLSNTQITSISSGAFYKCSSLTSIDIPDGVTSIGQEAFADCRSLTSIDIPEGVTSIGYAAFYGCSGLTSIDIPEGVTSIGNYAFRDCSSLASIDLSNTQITSIGERTFQNCSRLTSIYLPETVTSIGNYAFYLCSLTDVFYTGSEGQFNAITVGSNNTSFTNATKHYNYVPSNP